jgi:hypothetical protein
MIAVERGVVKLLPRELSPIQDETAVPLLPARHCRLSASAHTRWTDPDNVCLQLAEGAALSLRVVRADPEILLKLPSRGAPHV